MRQDQVNSIIAKHIRAYHESAKLRAAVFPEGYAKQVVDELAEAGFEITSKFPDSAANTWVLAQVTPGDVKVVPDRDGPHDHKVMASATAELVQWGGRGPGRRREISVTTWWGAHEDAVALASEEAMSLALRQARDAATGFANAAAAALQAPEPAAG